MELQLENRDYVPDGHGGVTGLRGMEALLARTLFRLTAHRGALPFLPELGCTSCVVPSRCSGIVWPGNMWPKPWPESGNWL